MNATPNGPRRELALILLAVLVVALVVYATGAAEGWLGIRVTTLPLRGAGVIGALVAAVGLAVFAWRRWREAETRARDQVNMFEQAVAGIFQSTRAGRYRAMNRAHARIYGYDSPAEMIAAVTDIARQVYVNPARRAAFLRELDETGKVENFETQVYQRNGRAIWVLANARAVRDARGRELYIEGNLQDITARKETEEAYRRLMDHSLQGILILRGSRIVFCNHGAAELLGMSAEELLAGPRDQLFELVHPDDRAQLTARARDLQEGKNVPAHSLFQVVRHDGTTRWVEANLSWIEYRGSRALLLLMLDVTARKQAQDNMQANMQDTRMREELGAVLARAGNDLPLVLNSLARVVARMVGDACAVELLSADGMWLGVAAVAHTQPAREAALKQALDGARRAADHPLLARVTREGQLLNLAGVNPERLAELGRTGCAGDPAHDGVLNYVLAPMRHGGRVIGALEVTRDLEGRPYTADELNLLQDFADRAALAIANAQLVSQLQAELEARRAAELKYRALVEQIPAIAYIASARRPGETLYMSPQVEALGYLPEQWTGDPDFWLSRIDPGDREAVEAEAAAARQTGRPFHAEYRLLARDGTPHWIRDDAVMVRDDGGTLLFQQGILLDLTAREQDARPAAARADQAFGLALAEAAALLSRATDADQVLDEILVTVGRIVPYETASVFLLEAGQLKMARARGFESHGLGEWIKGVTFPADLGRFRRLAAGQPIVLEDAARDPDWVKLPETAWIRGNLTVPIRIGGGMVGMLCLDSTRPGFYTAEHAAQLMSFADFTATALHTARLLEERERRAQQLSLLYDAGLTLNRALQARTQLDFLFKIAQRALRADRMAFFRCDAREHALHFELGVDVPRELEERMQTLPLDAGAPPTLVGWVAQNRLPARVPDVSLDTRWQNLDATIRSAVATPVEHERELHGVLVASSYTLNAFDVEDERLLILIANQVAAAIELTGLFQAQGARQRELEILREAGLEFTAAQEREPLIRLILAYALRLVAADQAALYLYEDDHLIPGGLLSGPAVPEPARKGLPWQLRETGFTYAVARQGQTLLADEVNRHPLFVSQPWGGAVVGLPLRGSGTVRAVLNVLYLQPHRFDADELRSLELLADQAAVALESARHYRETQVQLEHARLLHQAGEALNSTLSLHATLERMADFFLLAAHAQTCTVTGIDLAKDEFVTLLDRDPRAALRVAPGTVFHAADVPYLHEITVQHKTLCLRRDDSALDALAHEMMVEYDWQSALIVPLLAQEHLIGVVTLGDLETLRDFSPDQVRLVESLAHQASSALWNAQLFEQAAARAGQLALLNRVAYAVGGARTLEELLAIVERETMALVPADSFFIGLYDEARNEVDFKRFVNNGQPLAPFRWNMAPSLTRQVIQSRRTVRLDDRTQGPSSDNPPQYYGDGPLIHSWLGAPMRSGERVIGIISLQTVKRKAFGQAEEQLLQTIADQVAVAVERIRAESTHI